MRAPARSFLETLPLLLLSTQACNCQEDGLHRAEGSLHIRVINIGAEIASIETQIAVAGTGDQAVSPQNTPAQHPETNIVETLIPNDYKVRVVARDALGAPSRSVSISDVFIFDRKTTEIEVDLSSAPPVMIPPVGCEQSSALPLCTACKNGFEDAADDDPRCGTISCHGLDRFELRGDNGPVGTSSCVHLEHPDITDHRCIGRLMCVVPNGPGCTTHETKVAEKGTCQVIRGCEQGNPVVSNVQDGTPCGTQKVCSNGHCVAQQEPPDAGVGDASTPPETGCSDGTREGFLSLGTYPAIAGCSGGWSLPGVTIAGQQPACNRVAGNSSGNPSGTGCAATDLCAAGWHVCNGQAEVAAKAPLGCGDAVPPGTADKMLFFAVDQHSQMNTVCDPSTGDNDVFGCGNLGVQLTPDKNCGPLNRALASTHAGSCGYNEAEPNLGPWQCQGGVNGDLHEGSLVTKHGCPNTSCSYSGQPIGDADKGGVLCCHD